MAVPIGRHIDGENEGVRGRIGGQVESGVSFKRSDFGNFLRLAELGESTED